MQACKAYRPATESSVSPTAGQIKVLVKAKAPKSEIAKAARRVVNPRSNSA